MTERRHSPASNCLATKFYTPPIRPNAVPRSALVEKLLTGVNRPGAFTLVSGPAGFGKTTLLGELTAAYGAPLAWISLDESDNDPIQFWLVLLTACQSIAKDIGEAALERLSTPQSLRDETIPTQLINDLAEHNASLVLVLDDYHVIQHEAVHNGMLFLLNHLPHNLHIIISTRIDPPWPLVRFRARHQLVEIRAGDLRFSVDEARAFLNHTMGLGLSGEHVTALAARTEGWVAGLQLAALILQGREDAATFIRDFTGCTSSKGLDRNGEELMETFSE